MMAWWHFWGCRPLLTASHNFIGCIEYFWAPLYAVDMHIGGPLHCYTWGGHPDNGNLGSAWLQLNDGMMTLLRLLSATDCFPHSYMMYEKCLSTFICCGLACGFTLSLLQLAKLAQILVIWGQYGSEMMACCHCWDCKPLLTAFHIHIGIWKVFEHLHMLWIGI
jgi:hypothetical protein